MQKFLIYSFLQLHVDQRESFDVGVELTSIILLLFECKKKQYMMVHVFLTLVGSKANWSNDNPCDQWMVLVAANWIGNWILVIIWKWFFPIFMSLIIDSIGVQLDYILFV